MVIVLYGDFVLRHLLQLSGHAAVYYISKLKDIFLVCLRKTCLSSDFVIFWTFIL